MHFFSGTPNECEISRVTNFGLIRSPGAWSCDDARTKYIDILVIVYYIGQILKTSNLSL